MKRLFLTMVFILAFGMQAGVMAKGQWIYPYSHAAVAADVYDDC